MNELWSNLYIGLQVKYTSFLSDFNDNWIFWTVFRKIIKYQIVMNIRQVGPELFHVDGQTDRHDKANSRFSPLFQRD
jgi:hypothetical protein